VRLFLAATAASLCTLAGEAAAESFAASAVRVENAAAVVTVIPEDRSNVDIAIAPSARLPAPTARLTADGVVIDGGLRNRLRGCTSSFGGRTHVRIAGVGNVAHDDLPRITIRTPRALDLSLGGALFSDIGVSAGGAVTANGCGDTRLAESSGALDIDLNGSGDVVAARVGGTLTAVLNGSGSLRVERADAEAALRLNGSGDLDVGAVAGRVDARLSGSGSLNVAAAGGDARLVLNGSGDVEAGAISGSLDAELRGSGSVSVASVTGESASLDLSSSGDIGVRGGHVERLSAHNAGSGSVRFGGAAEATRATLSGSGDISIADAGRIEQMIDNGSGSISFGR
jgi:hypothetical protein